MRREPLAVSQCFECIEKLARRSCRANVVVVILEVGCTIAIEFFCIFLGY